MLRKLTMRARREDDSFVMTESSFWVEGGQERRDDLLQVIGVIDRDLEQWRVWLGVEW